MTWNELAEAIWPWFPAISTSTVVAILGVIFAPIYKSQIENTIKMRFDKQLEALRSQLRLEEESVKASFKYRDEQIAALRNGALSGLAARQESADKRRLLAIEKVWSSIVDARQLKTLSVFTSVLKMEAVVNAASLQSEDAVAMKRFLDQIWQSHKLDDVINIDWSDRERPFVTTSAWVKFTVYKQALLYPYSLIALARLGAGKEAISGPEKIIDSVASVLPHQREYLEKFGAGALNFVLEELEQSLLSELVISIHGEEADAQAIQLAATILRSASTLGQVDGPTASIIDVPASLKRSSI